VSSYRSHTRTRSIIIAGVCATALATASSRSRDSSSRRRPSRASRRTRHDGPATTIVVVIDAELCVLILCCSRQVAELTLTNTNQDWHTLDASLRYGTLLKRMAVTVPAIDRHTNAPVQVVRSRIATASGALLLGADAAHWLLAKSLDSPAHAALLPEFSLDPPGQHR